MSTLKPIVPQLVIGITGKAGHGKDTVATMIQDLLSHTLSVTTGIFRLADPLKEGYCSIFGIPRSALEDFDFKNEINSFTGTTHRQELQFLGTEAYRLRVGNPDMWIQLLSRRVTDSMSHDDIAIVPDIRFPNEAEFVKQNGLLIEVIREDSKLVTHSNHSSEAGIGDIVPDIVIRNDGTLTDLVTNLELDVLDDILQAQRDLSIRFLQAKKEFFLRRTT